MINEFSKIRYDLLLEEIDAYEEMGITEAQRSRGKLTSVSNALQELHAKIRSDGFPGVDEEILFFKIWKPLFAGRYLFVQEVYKIISTLPRDDHEAIKHFYKEELNYIEKFNSKHRFLREYYISDGTELDHLYFLRSGSPVNILWMEAPDSEKEFATAGDALYSKFKCNDWLKEYLLKALLELSYPGNELRSELRWTGDNVNLVELAYGLWLTGQFNDGNAGLSQIVRWLEVSCGVNIGIPQRRFIEIAARKRISITKYIDQMKEAIINKIDGRK